MFWNFQAKLHGRGYSSCPIPRNWVKVWLPTELKARVFSQTSFLSLKCLTVCEIHIGMY